MYNARHPIHSKEMDAEDSIQISEIKCKSTRNLKVVLRFSFANQSYLSSLNCVNHSYQSHALSHLDLLS